MWFLFDSDWLERASLRACSTMTRFTKPKEMSRMNTKVPMMKAHRGWTVFAYEEMPMLASEAAVTA